MGVKNNEDLEKINSLVFIFINDHDFNLLLYL